MGCNVTGGVGPFTYTWHGYRDDGSPCNVPCDNPDFCPNSNPCRDNPNVCGGGGSCILSSGRTQFPDATLVFPTSNFYFFCVITDSGVSASDPNRTVTGYIRLSESDGPVGNFTVGAGPFHLGVDDVLFDASGSTNVTVPVSWTIDRYVGPPPQNPPTGIEDFLVLYSGITTAWVQFYSVSTVPMSLRVPASTFSTAGIYRMRLDVFDDVFNSHSSYQYFTIVP